MSRRSQWSLPAFLVLLGLAVCPSLEGAKRELLTRSIYLPILFELCPHLSHGVLYIEEQPVARLPADRVFQFTYYPSLERVAPEVIVARIEATDLEGNPIVARLAIGPDAITTAHERVELDIEKQLKKLRYKIDTHYEKVRLLIRCGHWCGLREDPESTAPEEKPGAADPADGSTGTGVAAKNAPIGAARPPEK